LKVTFVIGTLRQEFLQHLDRATDAEGGAADLQNGGEKARRSEDEAHHFTSAFSFTFSCVFSCEVAGTAHVTKSLDQLLFSFIL
jgi:hypothetical protein